MVKLSNKDYEEMAEKYKKANNRALRLKNEKHKLNEKFKDLASNSRRKFKEFKSDIEDLETALKNKSEKIADLRQEVKKERAEKIMYKNRIDFSKEKDDIIKYILKLKAQNYLIGRIHKLIQREFDEKWDFDKIQKYLDIDNLNMDLKDYYYKEKDKYDKIREKDDERSRQNDMDNMDYMLNKVNIIIEKMDTNNSEDTRLLLKAIRTFSDVVDKKQKLNKELNGGDVIINERIQNITDSLDKKVEDIVEINQTDIEIC